MKNLRVGIVGCGNIFPMHGFSAAALDNVEVVAVCDNKKDRADDKAKSLNCKAYYDYKKMIDKENLDVLHICLPHYLHHEVTIYATSKKVHVLTEKPMSIKLEDAKAMIKSAEDNNVTLGVIFQNRYNPGSKLIKKTLESGELGKILSARLLVNWDRSDEYYSKSDWKGTWDKEGGGVIIDQAIHTLDLANWFINDEVVEVDSHIYNKTHKKIQVEDVAEGIIHYKNGVKLSFYTTNYNTYDAPVEIELHCENGIGKIVGDKGYINFNDGRAQSAEANPNEVFSYGDNFKSYWGVSHVKQIENFYDCIQKGNKLDISGRDALVTQEIICAIYDVGKSRNKDI